MSKVPPDSVRARIKGMETLLAAMKVLRGNEMAADARQVLEDTIRQGEEQLAALKKKNDRELARFII